MAAGLNIKRNSRIFHIANECYVIYLGVKTDEDCPFLRVGNMEEIDDRILDVISNTVIAARFTGNPLYELKLDKNREINYIGDTAVINRMKTYLNSFELSSDGAVDYHSIKDREQRDVIYFYNNGNIKLNYKDEPIFDLYKRSEADQHFVRQCDEIKKSFSRNPLRYTKHDFRGNGILLSGDNLLLFSASRFFSASLGSDYFSQLAAVGIDPDHINVHYSPIDSGLESEDSSFALMEMLKRSSFRNSSFSVLAKNPEYATKIGSLFPGAQIRPSGAEWTQLFPGVKTRDRGVGLEIHNNNLRSDIIIGGDTPSPESMTLNQFSGILSIHTESGVSEISIPDGILCNIKTTPHSVVEMTEIYISRLVPLIKGFSSDSDYKIAVAIQKMLKMLATVVDGKSTSGLIMRSTVFNFSDLLRNVHLESDSILTCFLENAITILDLSLSRTEIDTKIVKNINSVKSDIKIILTKSEKADSLLPVACDIFTEESPMLLYRSVKSTAKKADYLLAAEIAREITGEHDLSPQYYSEEISRLLKLIDMLSSATALEVDKHLEKEKPSEPYRERKTEITDSRGSKSESILGDQDKTGQSRKGLKSTRSGSRRRKLPLWLLLLLIPLVLLLAFSGYKGIDYLINNNSDYEKAIAKYVSEDGTPENGTPEDGTPEDGTPENGAPEDGAPEDGAPEEKKLEKKENELKLKDSSVETDNREDQLEVRKLETEDRPRTAEEVKAYLAVGDYHISAIDIHLVSNKIAVDNNYRDLDYEIYDGADPDWIYPGNEILLPDGSVHHVMRGDTIWYLAARFIRTSLDRDVPLFEENREEAEIGNTKARALLEGIAKVSPCEAFREKIHEVLKI